MEFFIIEREDGKYLSKYFNYNYALAYKMNESWTENIYNAKLFSSQHNANLNIERLNVIGLTGIKIKRVNLIITEIENDERI